MPLGVLRLDSRLGVFITMGQSSVVSNLHPAERGPRDIKQGLLATQATRAGDASRGGA